MNDKFTLPHFGDYTKVLTEQLVSLLNWDLIPPVAPSERSIELGAKYCNELMCLPAKVGLGGFIEACEKGATKLLMFDSCGQCRLKTYWILQERALKKLGYNVAVYPIRLGRHTPSDIRRADSRISLGKAWVSFAKILSLINEFDKSHYPEIVEESNLVKIGVVGEIYTILEPGVNRRLVTKIEKMGALVHISLPLSYFIFKGFYNRGWMKRRGIDQELYFAAREKAHEYFPKEIGGHGNESIMHTIYYALKGFDGVIHVLPFPCMPESTVAPVVDDISHDFNIPVMRLIFDTQTGEAGLNTRLEAFVDILKRKKRHLVREEQSLKSGGRKKLWQIKEYH